MKKHYTKKDMELLWLQCSIEVCRRVMEKEHETSR